MNRPGIVGAAAALAVAALALAPPAGADWLLTRDGARVETAGPWQVEGRLVVFTDSRGVLASLRLAEVDLEASAAATAAWKESTDREAAAAPAAPPAPRRAVWVLTDADVARVAKVGEGATATSDGGEGEGAAEPGEGDEGGTGLRVTTWDRTVDPASGEAAVVGELRNGGETAVPAPPLQVSVFDENGGELATATAVFDSSAIPPGQGVTFQAVFPGVGTFAAARFAIGEAGGGAEEPAAVTPDTPESPPGPAP